MSQAYVLDVSVTLAWCFANEATPESTTLLQHAVEDTQVVPSLWHVELRNVLLQAEKRQRLTIAQTLLFLDLLAGLEIETDLRHADAIDADLMNLARRHGLTAYDAAYLDLAVARSLALATRDKALIRAAAVEGVAVVKT